MGQIFDEGSEYLVKDQTLYHSLLFDDDIEKEAPTTVRHFDSLATLNRIDSQSIITHHDNLPFIKGVTLSSIAENYHVLDPADYNQLRNEIYDQYKSVFNEKADSILYALAFKVMPHFVDIKKGNKLDSGQMEKATIELLQKSLGDIHKYSKHDSERIKEVMESGKVKQVKPKAPKKLEDGGYSGSELNSWINSSARALIYEREQDNLNQFLKNALEGDRLRMPILLSLADKQSVEIENFGFEVNGPRSYTVWVNTGEYALREFNSHDHSKQGVYLFPSCKVGVNVDSRLVHKARIIDKYKHPFVQGNAKDQQICTNNRNIDRPFSAENVILSLEDAINTLQSGYFPGMNHKGYHSLDGQWQRGGANLDFENYRISETDKRILSGEIPITNEFTFKR